MFVKQNNEKSSGQAIFNISNYSMHFSEAQGYAILSLGADDKILKIRHLGAHISKGRCNLNTTNTGIESGGGIQKASIVHDFIFPVIKAP